MQFQISATTVRSTNIEVYPIVEMDSIIKMKIYEITDSIDKLKNQLYIKRGLGPQPSLSKWRMVVVVNHWSTHNKDIQVDEEFLIFLDRKDSLSNNYFGEVYWEKSQVRKYGYMEINGFLVLAVDVKTGSTYFDINANEPYKIFQLMRYPPYNDCLFDGVWEFLYIKKDNKLLIHEENYNNYICVE